jgi:hypothetical protein
MVVRQGLVATEPYRPVLVDVLHGYLVCREDASGRVNRNGKRIGGKAVDVMQTVRIFNNSVGCVLQQCSASPIIKKPDGRVLRRRVLRQAF